MEDKGFRKKPRHANPQAIVHVADNGGGGARPGGKAGGQKGGKTPTAQVKPVEMRVIGGRAKRSDPDVVDHISRQLKAVYDEVVTQPVPSRFIELISKLDKDSGR
jgi:Anti-sigma factor NepR